MHKQYKSNRQNNMQVLVKYDFPTKTIIIYKQKFLNKKLIQKI